MATPISAMKIHIRSSHCVMPAWLSSLNYPGIYMTMLAFRICRIKRYYVSSATSLLLSFEVYPSLSYYLTWSAFLYLKFSIGYWSKKYNWSAKIIGIIASPFLTFSHVTFLVLWQLSSCVMVRFPQMLSWSAQPSISVKQELFSERRFTRVRVRDNRKCAASFDLVS